MAFDDRKPPAEAWDRIEESLPRQKQRSLWASVGIWRAAAILFMGLSAYLIVSPDRQSGKHEGRQMQGEFKAVESYYIGEIQKKVKLINDFGGTFETSHFSQYLHKLDAMYLVLSEEMKVRPTEQVRDALILNMLVRVDLLNQQIKKLEETRQQNPESSTQL